MEIWLLLLPLLFSFLLLSPLLHSPLSGTLLPLLPATKREGEGTGCLREKTRKEASHSPLPLRPRIGEPDPYRTHREEEEKKKNGEGGVRKEQKEEEEKRKEEEEGEVGEGVVLMP